MRARRRLPGIHHRQPVPGCPRLSLPRLQGRPMPRCLQGHPHCHIICKAAHIVGKATHIVTLSARPPHRLQGRPHRLHTLSARPYPVCAGSFIRIGYAGTGLVSITSDRTGVRCRLVLLPLVRRLYHATFGTHSAGMQRFSPGAFDVCSFLSVSLLLEQRFSKAPALLLEACH